MRRSHQQTFQRDYYFVVLAALLGIFIVPLQAWSQATPFSIQIRLEQDRKNLAIRFTNPDATCTFALFSGQTAKQAQGHATKNQALFRETPAAGAVVYVANNLVPLRVRSSSQRPLAYFVARLTCGVETSESTLKRVRPKTSTRTGKRSVSGWLRQLPKRMGALSVSLVDAFPTLSFSAPVDLQTPPDSTGRLFVVEQDGLIYVLSSATTTAQKTLFLDLSTKTNASSEQGLLAMAFHPNYATNRRFYVHYSRVSDGATIIAEYLASEQNPNVADSSSERIILTQSQPYSNHNGGQIVFGPDGYLYIGLGDGGSGGDPEENGQSLSTLLGKILRINVDATSGSLAYAIPSDNPFAGNSSNYREEIFAYGLRNPWKISFDSANGTLYAADVGQGAIEEVDIIESGKNYGWNTMEGHRCYDPSTDCNTTGLALPIATYNHDIGQSITGGYVYRGTTIPSLVGQYVYGDFSSGRIFSVQRVEATYVVSSLISSNLAISSFGVDANKELYVVDYSGGKLYRFAAD